jgi:hypothetical protein
LGDCIFEMSTRHTNTDLMWVVGYASLDFKAEIWQINDTRNQEHEGEELGEP